MKTTSLITILALIFILQSFIIPNKKKPLKDIFSEMIALPACEFFTGEPVPLSNELLKDSVLVLSKDIGKAKVSPFLLHSKEVSIKEWKLFYSEKEEEIGKEEAMRLFHTDTLCWLYEIPLSYGESYVMSYYKHPAYEDYPIVGVDWYQATEYCKWLTKRANQTLGNHGIAEEVEFRLPTALELEYAALVPDPDLVNSPAGKIGKFNRTTIPFYVWPSIGGKYFANFGEIYSVNNVRLKYYRADGYSFTNPPESYSPNGFGLYNISGNVAEWTSSTAVLPNNERELSMDSLLKEITQNLSNLPDNDWNKKYKELLLKSIVHDIEMIEESEEKKVVKGGSWADSLPYLYCNAEEVQFPSHKSCRVGFRVAMTYNKELERYYKKLGITQK